MVVTTRSTTPPVIELSDDLSLPIDAVTETFAVIGRRGRGKTNGAGVLVEGIVRAGQPVVVLDPTGAWWGLRTSADGTKPGLPVVIFGGDHADVPLESTAGKIIADVVVEKRVSVVIDLSRLDSSELIRFCADFLDRLYRKNRDPLMVVIDEADVIAPQRPTTTGTPADKDNARRLRAAIGNLGRRGRIFGLGYVLITQRPAAIEKDILSQTEVLIAFGLTNPRDASAIDDWVSLHDDGDQAALVKESLAGLGVGEAWVWSPSFLGVLKHVHIRQRTTFDSSATPKVGVRRITPQTSASIDLTALGASIAATAEKQAENDPDKLKERIRSLESELTRAREKSPVRTVASEPSIREVSVPVFQPEVLAMLRDLVDQASSLSGEVAYLRTRADSVLSGIASEAAAAVKELRSAQALSQRSSAATAPVRIASKTIRPATTFNDSNTPVLGRAELSILAALATYGPRSSVQLAMLTGRSHKSGGFRNALSKLRSGGLIEGGKDNNQLTEAGTERIADGYEPLPQGQSLVDHWKSQLGKAERGILDATLDVWPDTMTHDEIAEVAGYSGTSGGFRNALSRLRTLEIIRGRGDAIRVNDELGEAHRAG